MKSVIFNKFNLCRIDNVLYLIVILFALMGIAGCFKQKTKVIKYPDSVTIIKEDKLRPRVTIWIHGSHLFPWPDWIIENYFCPSIGLINSSKIEKNSYVYTILKTISESNPTRYPLDNFYAFGWSGKLSNEERAKSAKILYTQLKNVILDLKTKNNIMPYITIITHSHGGNVALNLANIKDPDDTEFKVDKLIVLACPVQKHTKYCVKNSIFGKIYSVYSAIDMLQVLDPQGLHKIETNSIEVNNIEENNIDKSSIKKPQNYYKSKIKRRGPLFSQRTFEYEPKLKQIKIKLSSRAILHVEFIMTHFLKLLDTIINKADLEQSNNLFYNLSY